MFLCVGATDGKRDNLSACIVDGSFDQLERVFSRTKDKARIKFMTANDEFISVHLNFLFVKLVDRTRSG